MKLKCNFDLKFEGVHVPERTRKRPPRVRIRPGKARKPRIPPSPSVPPALPSAPALGFNPTLTPPSLSPSLADPLGSSRIRPPRVPDQPRHSSSQPRPDTTPHPSPGRPRPPLIPAQVGPDPYPGPVPHLDTPRFPYKAQKQLQAHIKPNPPATKKNPTQAGHNPSSQLRSDSLGG